MRDEDIPDINNPKTITAVTPFGKNKKHKKSKDHWRSTLEGVTEIISTRFRHLPFVKDKP